MEELGSRVFSPTQRQYGRFLFRNKSYIKMITSKLPLLFLTNNNAHTTLRITTLAVSEYYNITVT